MEHAASKVTTDFTCWKCGEESLKEATFAPSKAYGGSDAQSAMDIHHSNCQKCGAYSVNARQALYNKTAGRKSRKHLIRESNRISA